MKKILALLLGVCSILSLSACTYTETLVTEDYLTYTVPEEMIAVTQDNIPSEILIDMKKEEEEVKEYLSQNLIKVTSFYKTTNEDGTADYPYELFITAANSSYSENVFDFNRLSEADLEVNKNSFVDIETANKQGYTVSDIRWVDNNGAKYLAYKYNVTSNEISQYGEQFMTIYNGNIYCFSAISYEGETEVYNNLKDKFFSTLAFSEKLEATEAYDPEFNNLPKTLLRFWKENTLTICVGVVLLAVLIAFIIYSVKTSNKSKPKADGTVRADYLH